MEKYVAYYRISKENKKSKSKGLGLASQKSIVEHFYKQGIERSFTEIKSAKNITERPILKEAIQYCLENGCTLVVAKIDRLSRNVDDCRYVLSILKGNLLSCDIPGTIDKFTLTLYAAFAERERELIALRTSQALRAKIKKEGAWQKGNPQFKDQSIQVKANKAVQELANTNENSIRASEMICSKRKEGLNFKQIAELLNQKKFYTPKGKQFQAVQVQRIYQRFC